MRRAIWIGAGLAALGAALSLLLPYMPVYDPWGWLVWGRELGRFDLATAAGPSWKPLPVLIDAPLSLLGGGAPQAWLLIARGGWLLAPLLAAGLTVRLAGPAAGAWRWPAAGLAAASVALTGDSFTPPLRQFSGGLSEPLLVALVLGAVWLGLERRPRGALWLGAAASLLRPECWPFLALWGVRQAARQPFLRPDALAVAALIPLAWFVPDLLGAGNPLQGPQTARQGAIEPAEAAEVAGRALAAPLAAAWLGVAMLLGLRRWGGGALPPAARREERALTVLLAGAAAWIALVAAMSVAGFAGLPRFLAPASAAISIVGAVGIARAGVAARGFASGAARWLLAGAATVAVLGAAVGIGLRAAQVPGDVRTIERQTRSQQDLFQLADRLGADRLLSCGGTVRVTNLLAQTSLAWRLDIPIEATRVRRRPHYGVVLTTHPIRGTPLDVVGDWQAVERPCRNRSSRG